MLENSLWYDYIILCLCEMWCLVPLLYYQYLILQLLQLEKKIITKLMELGKSNICFYHENNKVNERYKINSTILKLKIKTILRSYKKILDVYYNVLSNKFGLVVSLVVISYSISLIHELTDCTLELPILIKILAICRATHRCFILITIFAAGQTATITVSFTINMNIICKHRIIKFI